VKRRGILCALLILAFGVVCRGDLQVQTLEPSRQDRFYEGADKNFLGQAFDWSGVGQTGGGAWATMISAEYFVSAAHFHPTDGETLTFFEGNDPSGPSHQFTVSSWSYQTSYAGLPSDLWLGKLTTPIPASDRIATYPVLGLPNLNDYIGRMIYVNGKPNRVGRNVIDSIVAATEGTPPYKDTVSMQYDYNTVSGLGADECYLIGGDSGGPSFVDAGGRLALVGIHYYNGGTPDPVDLGPISGDSFVPYYISQLDANMVGASVSVVVPEPSTVVLLLAATLSVAFSGRIRKSVLRDKLGMLDH
jgi:hypothetical protein